MFTGNETPVDEFAFLSERYCLSDLVVGLRTPCPCGRTNNPWNMESVVQVSCIEPDPPPCNRAYGSLLYLQCKIIIEGPCVETTVFLSAMPQGKENLVQLQSIWGTLLAEPEVRFTLLLIIVSNLFLKYRMVHSFTCAGVLPAQYIKLSQFVGMGQVGHGYMKKGKNRAKYNHLTWAIIRYRPFLLLFCG